MNALRWVCISSPSPSRAHRPAIHARLQHGDDLRPVDYLALALGLEQIEDEFGVAGFGRVDLVAIEEFERIEDGGGLLGTVGLGDAAQGLLRGLEGVPALPVGDERRELRVFRRAVDEMLS